MPKVHLGSFARIKISFLVGFLCVFLISQFSFLNSRPASAAVGINGTINFQGKLVNADGTNVPNGTYNIEYKIYQDGDGLAGGAAETLKWTETRLRNNSQGVSVTDGIFQVNLGSVNTALATAVDFNQDTLWLSINVGNTNATCTDMTAPQCNGDGEMYPLIRFTATPYALNSGKLGGMTSSQFVQLAQGVQTDASTVPSIFINKTGASGNILQLQKAGSDVFTIDNAGTIITIGSSSGTNLVSNGALTIKSSGAGNDVIIDGTDQFIVQDTAIFNADASFVLNDSETFYIGGTITGTTAVDVGTLAVTNNTSSGIQNGLVVRNDAGTGATDSLIVVNNADTDTAVTTGLTIQSAAGGITTGIDVSDTDIGTGINLGANDIIGTSAVIDFSSFDVASNGLITTANNIAVNGGSITTSSVGTAALFNTNATTLNIGGATDTGGINLAGGSASTGCSIDGSTGSLVCSGSLTTSNTSGTVGFFSRNNATSTLQPATAGDHITTSGNISTTGSGTITAAGTLNATGILNANATDKTAISIADSGSQNSGITIGGDTNLYRSAANTLKTDDNLLVQTVTNSAAALQVSNSSGTSLLNVNSINGNITTNLGSLTVNGLASPGSPTLTFVTSGGSLPSNTTYAYRLAAINAAGASTEAVISSPASITTGNGSNNNQTTLTWSAVSGAASYKVYRSTNGGSWFVNSFSSGTTSITDNGTTYTWATAETPANSTLAGGINLTGGGSLTFGANNGGNVVLQASASATTNYVIRLPNAQGSVNTVLQNDGSGNLSWVGGAGCSSCLAQVPATTAQNTVSPTAASVVALTVNSSSNATSATALVVNQNSTFDGVNLNVTNSAGIQTNALLINRNAAGGTTTNGLQIAGTAGTLTNGLMFSGTIGTDITTAASRGLSISGNAASSFTTTSGTLTLQGGSGTVSLGTSTNLSANAALTVNSGGSGTLTLKTADSTSATTAAISLKSGDASVGSNLSSGAVAIDSGTKTGTGTAGAVNIGTTNAPSVNIGQTTTNNSSLNFNGVSTFKPVANSTTAFQIQSAAGSNLLAGDTTNLKISITNGNLAVTGMSTPSAPTLTAVADANNGTQGGRLSGSGSVTHFYKITAVNGSGESMASSSASFAGSSFNAIPNTVAPGLAAAGTGTNSNTYRYMVTFISSVNGGETIGTAAQITLALNTGVTVTVPTYSGASSDITSRKIYRCLGSGCTSWALVTTIANNTTTSYSDNPIGATSAGTPPATNTFRSSTNQLQISWSAVTGATGYKIYYATTSGSELLLTTPGQVTGSPQTDVSTWTTSGGTSVPGSNTSGSVGIGIASPTANLDVRGNVLFKNDSNSTTAFQVQNAANTSLLTVDTSGSRVLVENAVLYAQNIDVVSTSSSTISRVARTTASSGTSFGTDAFTPSGTFTPLANKVLIAYVTWEANNQAMASDGSDVTISGGSLTWVPIEGEFRKVRSGSWGDGMRFFYAMTTAAPPSNMQVTTDAGAASIAQYHVRVDEMSGVDLVSPVGGAVSTNRASNDNDIFTTNLGATLSSSDWKILIANMEHDTGAHAYDTPAGWSEVWAPGLTPDSTVMYQTGSTSTTLDYDLNANVEYANSDTVYGGFILRSAGGTEFNVGTTNAGIIAVGNSGSQTTLQNGTGGLTVRGADSTTAFQVQNAAATAIFAVDTTNGRVGVGLTAPGQEFEVQGDIRLDANGTATLFGLCHSGTDSDTTFADRDIVACSGTGVNDYAENYPTENDVEYGEVVVLGDSSITVNAGDGFGNKLEGRDFTIQKLKRATRPYQKSLIGITSKNFTDFSSLGKKDIPLEHHPMPVALNGRVPVKVASSSEPIEAGDFLTTSNEPGKVMKATKSGQMVGKALEPWVPSGKSEIMVFVTTSFADPADSDKSSTEALLTSLSVSGDVKIGGNLTVEGAISTQDVVVDGVATVNKLVVETVEVSGNLTVAGTASIATLKVSGNAEFTGDINLAGVGQSRNAITKKFKASKDLHIGDVVVGDSTQDGQVTTTNAAGDTKVLGVALTDTPAGQEVVIAIGGTVQVKAADAVTANGDLLVSSDQEGKASKSVAPISGTIIGKALGKPDAAGLVWILVTLN